MSPENWQQVKSLLDACLDRPDSERLAYLDSACPDPEMRSEVVSLLEAHENSTAFLEDAPPLDHKAAVAFQPNIMAGQRVGPYYLIEELGRGGMGTVYRAVRADYEFVLVVALKIVSRGMDTEMVLRRFRNERQILASLEHPYIARLLDGGTTETGLPYFVMEYVEGFRSCSIAMRTNSTSRTGSCCSARCATRSPTRTATSSCTGTSSPAIFW